MKKWLKVIKIDYSPHIVTLKYVIINNNHQESTFDFQKLSRHKLSN